MDDTDHLAYADGNSYVENLGGIDLTLSEKGNPENEVTNLAPYVNPEERRAAAISLVKGLPLNSVAELLAAAGEVEAWLESGRVPGGPVSVAVGHAEGSTGQDGATTA